MQHVGGGGVDKTCGRCGAVNVNGATRGANKGYLMLTLCDAPLRDIALALAEKRSEWIEWYQRPAATVTSKRGGRYAQHIRLLSARQRHRSWRAPARAAYAWNVVRIAALSTLMLRALLRAASRHQK